MKTKLLVSAVALAALPVVGSSAAFAQRTPPAAVVVVDSARIYRECNACRAAQTALQAQVATLQQRQQALGAPIQTEAQAIQQAVAAARNQPAAARTATETALQARIQALQTQENTANQELQRLQENLRSTQANVLQQINVRLNPIINEVMTQRGANLAVGVEATLAHAGALNVTNEVLAALNQRLPSVSVTPLPQQPGATPPPPAQRPRPQGR